MRSLNGCFLLLIGMLAAPATTQAGLLSPEAVMYGLSKSEIRQMLSAQPASYLGSSAAAARTNGESAPRHLRQHGEQSPSLLATSPQGGSAGRVLDEVRTGSGNAAAVLAHSLAHLPQITILVDYWNRAIPSPDLERLLRPPRP